MTNKAQFLEDRRAALLSLDEQVIRDHMAAQGIELLAPELTEAQWAQLHKERLGLSGLTRDQINQSISWLKDRGLDAMIYR